MKPVCFVSASLFSTHISIENKHVWLPKPCFSFSKSIRCYMNWSFLWEQVFNIWVNILLIISVPVLGWHWIFTTNLLTIINVQVLGLRWIFTTNYLLMLNAPRFLNIGSQSDCLFISQRKPTRWYCQWHKIAATYSTPMQCFTKTHWAFSDPLCSQEFWRSVEFWPKVSLVD